MTPDEMADPTEDGSWSLFGTIFLRLRVTLPSCDVSVKHYMEVDLLVWLRYFSKLENI